MSETTDWSKIQRERAMSRYETHDCTLPRQFRIQVNHENLIYGLCELVYQLSRELEGVGVDNPLDDLEKCQRLAWGADEICDILRQAWMADETIPHLMRRRGSVAED